MGRVSEALEDKLEEAARMANRDKEEVLEEWNRNLRHPTTAISVDEYIARLAKKISTSAGTDVQGDFRHTEKNL